MPPDKLEYHNPVASPRTAGRMLADAFVGLAQVGFGLIGCLIAVVLTESIWGRGRSRDVPDEPFDWVKAGVRRMRRGRSETPTGGSIADDDAG